MTKIYLSTIPSGLGFLLLAAVLEVLITTSPLAQAQNLTTLYSFTGGADGAQPYGTLVMDKQGNVYGTAAYGGIQSPNCEFGPGGCGTVFELTHSGGVWSFNVLHRFRGYPDDGANPLYEALAFDEGGNLYGTTLMGGPYLQGIACGTGCGTVFKLAPDGTETVLHSFQGHPDGWSPLAGLVLDMEGNLYGTTEDSGLGKVFEVTASGTEKVLYSFHDTPDGAAPEATLVFDKQGNLYGTTGFGGEYGCFGGAGCGTVFKLAPDGTETVLYSFTGGADGAWPRAGLVLDEQGNLYGTTFVGGSGCGAEGCGTVFQMTPTGTEAILHSFDDSDGANPTGGLVFDAKGNLYGTTSSGGAYGWGTVFKLTPSGGNWKETVLHSFKSSDGAAPYGRLLLKGGILYGTTAGGGAHNWGTVFACVLASAR